MGIWACKDWKGDNVTATFKMVIWIIGRGGHSSTRWNDQGYWRHSYNNFISAIRQRIRSFKPIKISCARATAPPKLRCAVVKLHIYVHSDIPVLIPPCLLSDTDYVLRIYLYTGHAFFLLLLLLWRSGQLLWSMFWLSELTNLIKMTGLDMHTRNSGWIKKKSTGQQGLYHRVCTEKSFQNSQTVYKPFRKPHLLIIHKIETKSYPSIWTKWRKLVVKQGDGKGRGA